MVQSRNDRHGPQVAYFSNEIKTIAQPAHNRRHDEIVPPVPPWYSIRTCQWLAMFRGIYIYELTPVGAVANTLLDIAHIHTVEVVAASSAVADIHNWAVSGLALGSHHLLGQAKHLSLLV